MRNRDDTEIGGPRRGFETTHWTLILDARTMDADRRRAAVADLLGRYWKPAYCYLRRKGNDSETAKDLTQSFFHDVVLRRGLIQRADRSQGRFRTFLLTALNRYVRNLHRDAHARKRMPSGGIVRMDLEDWYDVRDPADQVSPGTAFQYAWVAELLDRVFGDVEGHCKRCGLAAHWEVFRERCLLPTREGTEPPDLAEVCRRHGIDSEVKASNMLVTVKRRIRTTLVNYVRLSMGPDANVEQEIGDMLEALAERGAGS